MLRQKETGRLFDNIRVGLVRHPQDSYQVAFRHHCSDLIEQLLFGELVYPIGCLREWRFESQLLGGIGQQTVISRKARPAIAKASTEVLRTDASIASDCIQNCVNISLRKSLRDQAQLVGEADLHGDVTVDRDFRQLSADD